MGETSPVVFVVEDDAELRSAVESLLRSVGLTVRTFGSADEFLASPAIDAPGCAVLDLQLPGSSGLDLLPELTRRDPTMRVVFMSGHGDIPTAVRAMKAGAVEFLRKPVLDRELLDAVRQALEQARVARHARAERARLHLRLESLTPRERQVFGLVAGGLLNKQIAFELGISEATVKIHRGQVMQKMQASSVAELARMAERIDVSGSKQSGGNARG